MISNIYKKQIIEQLRMLEQINRDATECKKLFNEISEEQIDDTILYFMKKVGELSKTDHSKTTKEKQETIVETLYKYLGAIQVEMLIQQKKEFVNVTLDDQLQKLNALIGLDEVKQQINDLITYHQIQTLRVEQGLKKATKTLHMAFLGNPGTAKTTVARIVGKMFKEIGLLSKGQFIEASRTDLIAEYQGQTAMKVKRLIERAKGGVLFIDEAYSLTENDHSDSYGRESLTELTKALEDYRDDLVVIVAGYPDLMEQFFNSNPGLTSRFNTFITFPDYSVEELIDIFQFICSETDYQIEKDALEFIKEIIKNAQPNDKGYFSNGRFVRNLFDETIVEQAKRLQTLSTEVTKEILMLIVTEDVKSVNVSNQFNK